MGDTYFMEGGAIISGFKDLVRSHKASFALFVSYEDTRLSVGL